MWKALKLYAKLNGILKDHIVTWFLTGKLSPWKIFTDLTHWADMALTARGYKELSELKQESHKIHDMMDYVDDSADSKPKEKVSSTRVKPKPQERNRFGRLI